MSTNVLVGTSQVKFLTGITSTAYDLQIEALVPMVLDDITNYTQNYFIQSTRYFYDDKISFSSSGCITCNNTSIDLTDWLMAGSILHVAESVFNDGYFSCSTNLNSSIVYVNETVNAESSSTGKFILLQRVEYPKDLPLIASRMLKHLTVSQDQSDVKSESLGDHSLTFVDIGSNSYPVTIANGLKKYKKVRMI